MSKCHECNENIMYWCACTPGFFHKRCGCKSEYMNKENVDKEIMVEIDEMIKELEARLEGEGDG